MALLDMHPNLATHNPADRLTRNAVLATEGVHRRAALAPPTDLTDVLGGQMRLTAPLTARYPLGTGVAEVPPLGRHVGRVVRMAPQEQMIGVDAQRRIALVASKHPCRDWAMGQLPHDAMDQEPLPVNGHVPVALPVARPGPQQATVNRYGPHGDSLGRRDTIRATTAGAKARAILLVAILSPWGKGRGTVGTNAKLVLHDGPPMSVVPCSGQGTNLRRGFMLSANYTIAHIVAEPLASQTED